MKTCSTCGKRKKSDKFYRNKRMPDGLAGVCKECQNLYNKRWHDTHIDQVRELGREGKARQREREGEQTTRQKWNEWYKRNAEHRRKYTTEKRDPIKVKAHWDVYVAVSAGMLIRPNECSKCKKSCKPDAHHSDYSKTLDVIWLCRSCHRLLQNK